MKPKKFRVKYIASTKGMTLREVATRMGVTPQALNNSLNSKHSPNVSTLEKIASVLDVPVSSLFADYVSTSAPHDVCPHCGRHLHIVTSIKSINENA